MRSHKSRLIVSRKEPAQRQPVAEIPSHAWQLSDAVGDTGDNTRCRCGHCRYTRDPRRCGPGIIVERPIYEYLVSSRPMNLSQLFHPAVAKWFVGHFAEATPAQTQAWPAIKAGRDTLIAAPTGSGKTLAAFLAAIDD